MKTKTLLLVAYFPLTAVLILVVIQMLSTGGEAVAERSAVYMPLVALSSIASAAIMAWTLVHLYWLNEEVDSGERFRWTVALLLVTIFAVPRYFKQFVLEQPPT